MQKVVAGSETFPGWASWRRGGFLSERNEFFAGEAHQTNLKRKPLHSSLALAFLSF